MSLLVENGKGRSFCCLRKLYFLTRKVLIKLMTFFYLVVFLTDIYLC